MSIKAIVILVLILVYLYELFLDVVELRSTKNPIPENVSDIYNEEEHERWRAYTFEKTRLGMITGGISLLISIVLIITNAYAAFASLFQDTPFMQLFAVLLLSSLSGLLLLPFSYYDTMVIEEKYGFNRTRKKTFWADQAKQLVIEILLLTGIGSALMWTHRALGDWLILAFALLMTAVVLIISFLYPFLSRIFNKFTPLEEGELKDKVTALLTNHGYKVRAIQIMDASRRSSKSNAYFTGFGKMKTIVLYDTLVEKMTPDEICAVFAHEMGHGLHKDTLKNQIISFVQMLILAVLAWLTFRSDALFTPFGFSSVNYGFALFLIMNVEFALISPLFGLIANAFSRKAEYLADRQAVQEGYGMDLISALKKLAKQNYADVAPSPLLVKLEYSHPTLSQRITAITAQEQVSSGGSAL